MAREQTASAELAEPVAVAHPRQGIPSARRAGSPAAAGALAPCHGYHTPLPITPFYRRGASTRGTRTAPQVSLSGRARQIVAYQLPQALFASSKEPDSG